MSETLIRLSRFNATFQKRCLVRFSLVMSRIDMVSFFVTLLDSVFDPSEVFDHCAQQVNTLKMTGLKVTVLVLQTDGDPDLSLKRVTT